MLLKELQVQLDLLLNAALFKDYGPNGLQVEGKEKIQKAATAVSATRKAIEEAAEQGVDALIVHHGLFWNKDPYPIVGAKKEKLQLLLENGISLFAYHLPLDAHTGLGNNWRAARDLGWDNLESFQEFGVKGSFSPLSIEDLLTLLEKYYAHNATAALFGKKKVMSAALISGGAYKELAQAAREGVDCFITGNFDEPAWSVAQEERINFLALGHAATERVGPRALAEFIRKQLDLEAFFIDTDNPF